MADTKISALTAGNAIQDADEFAVARGAANVKVLGSEMMRLWQSSQITSASSPYTMDFGTVLEVDASGGNVIVDLPTILANKGKSLVVKKMDGSANTVTITPTGGQTIDGQATHVLTQQYEGLQAVVGSLQWLII